MHALWCGEGLLCFRLREAPRRRHVWTFDRPVPNEEGVGRSSPAVPMKKRRSSNAVKVEAVPLANVSRLVTLEDPADGVDLARGAFVRLRPPPDHPPEATARWRGQVAHVARAVRVVPAPRSAAVPDNAKRVDPEQDVADEAIKLARETKDPEVIALVEDAIGVARKGRT